jgi:2-keto-4-pentenoate hydratase/2-oxohepta-3-ene-1,7-dioic acid hydratase in catechol pathway
MQDTLNDFISDGKKTWRLVRNRIADLFDEENPKLRDIAKHRDIVIFNIDEVEMQLPVLIGDYTDFYSSKEHATNVGKMFRDPENALLPNSHTRRISWEKFYQYLQEFQYTGLLVKHYLLVKPRLFLGLRLIDFELETALLRLTLM